MRDLKNDFKNKIIDEEKLLDFGFIQKKDDYYYEKNICDHQFKIVIQLSKEKQISKVIDLLTEEEYILVDIENSSGNFVGRVKEEYEIILNDMMNRCTIPNIFKGKQTKEIIKYVKEKYYDDLEYLWEKFPNNAVWRNKDNNKWYGVLLVIPKNKLGIASDEMVEILDLRYPKDDIHKIIDHKKIFGGYHMNKNNWITIKLDESINIQEIFQLIDSSYQLSLKK